MPEGTVAVGALAGLSPAARTAGLTLTISPRAPVTARGAALVHSPERSPGAVEAAGHLAFRTTALGLAACPLVGVEWIQWSSLALEPLYRSTTIPIGIGIGLEPRGAFPDGVSLYVLPQVLIVRGLERDSGRTQRIREPEWRLETGVGASAGRKYVRLFGTFASGDAPVAPSIGLLAGFVLGRR